MKSSKAPPEVKHWHEFFLKEKQETPKRIEDAAKHLATMISISLTIFLAIGKSSFEEIEKSLLLKSAVISWIFSLLLSFFVLFPWPYRYIKDSAKEMREVHEKIVRDKYRILIFSCLLFLYALVVVVILFLF